MYTAIAQHSPATSDMAARLTDVALEALAGARTLIDSVDLELTLWHTLEAELEWDRLWQRVVPRRGEIVALGKILQQVVNRAARRVADSHSEDVDGYLCGV